MNTCHHMSNLPFIFKMFNSLHINRHITWLCLEENLCNSQDGLAKVTYIRNAQKIYGSSYSKYGSSYSQSLENGWGTSYSLYGSEASTMKLKLNLTWNQTLINNYMLTTAIMEDEPKIYNIYNKNNKRFPLSLSIYILIGKDERQSN